MLLGQLYYYNKALDDIKLPLSADSAAGIELAGLPKQSAEDFRGMDSSDIVRNLRDKFSATYEEVLENESLSFAHPYWQLLTSPLVQKPGDLTPTTDFQNLLLSWQQNQFPLQDLRDVLASGALSLDQEDFAIYYGLRVLATLSNLAEELSSAQELNIPEVRGADEVSDKAEILVLTKEYLSPLFVNLNCRYLPILEEDKDTLKSVQSTLSEEPEIKLILADDQDEKLVQYLQKQLGGSPLVTSVQFEDFSQDAFFDQIVRKTLGVKLT